MCGIGSSSFQAVGKGEAAVPGDNFGISGGFSPPQVRKHINDLYEDLRDGHNLISLLEVLSGVKLVSAQILEIPLNPLHALPAPLHPQLSFLTPWFQLSVVVSFIIGSTVIYFYIYYCILNLFIFTQTSAPQAELSSFSCQVFHTFTFQLWLHI